MYYDLNVPFTTATDPNIPTTLSFLSSLGYTIIALSFTLTGKLPAEHTCPIPSPLPFPIPSNLTVLRRLTLPLPTPLSNARLKSLSAGYDILALRPLDEKALQAACTSLDTDIISVDLTQRLGYHFRFKPLAEACRRGVRFEINYAGALDASARRNVLSNVVGLVRASRGRGLLVSSEARRASACRAPADVANLLVVWGMKNGEALEAVGKEPRGVVVRAGLRKSGWRGVVDVVQPGMVEGPQGAAVVGVGKAGAGQAKKRKAGEALGGDAPEKEGGQVSKREMKRRAKKAREEAAAKSDGAPADTASVPADTTAVAQKQ